MQYSCAFRVLVLTLIYRPTELLLLVDVRLILSPCSGWLARAGVFGRGISFLYSRGVCFPRSLHSIDLMPKRTFSVYAFVRKGKGDKASLSTFVLGLTGKQKN